MGGMTRGAFYHHFKSKEEVFDRLSDKLFSDDNPFDEAKKQDNLTGLEKLKYILQRASTADSESQQLSISVMQLLDSPAFLKKLIIDTNRDTLVPICQEIIEEGIKDGSIRAQNAKMTAEIFVFSVNFWTIPTIFPITEEEAWDKIKMLKTILDSIGLPVLDDDYLEQFKQN